MIVVISGSIADSLSRRSCAEDRLQRLTATILRSKQKLQKIGSVFIMLTFENINKLLSGTSDAPCPVTKRGSAK